MWEKGLRNTGTYAVCNWGRYCKALCNKTFRKRKRNRVVCFRLLLMLSNFAAMHKWMCEYVYKTAFIYNKWYLKETFVALALVLQCYTIVASPALHGLAYRGSVEGRERDGDVHCPISEGWQEWREIKGTVSQKDILLLCIRRENSPGSLWIPDNNIFENGVDVVDIFELRESYPGYQWYQ